MKRFVVFQTENDVGIPGGCVCASPFGMSGRGGVLALAVFVCLILCGPAEAAASPDDIVGKW